MDTIRFNRALVFALAVLTAAGVLLVLPALLTAPPAEGQQRPMCAGRPATHIGTPGKDVIRGTAGNDVIVTFGGPDIIFGLGGNDRICSGGGNDQLIGGRGNDLLYAGDGNDKIVANQGADLIEAGRGNDNIFGGPGRDVCRGGFGTDRATDCEVQAGVVRPVLVVQRSGTTPTGGTRRIPFAATKGETLYVNFSEVRESISIWDGDWDVVDNTGKVVESSINLGDARDSFVVPSTGNYSLLVHADEGETIPFRVQVVRAPNAVKPVALNVQSRQRIGIPGEKHRVRFTAKAGDWVYFDFEGVENVWVGEWDLYPTAGFDRSAVADSFNLDDDDDAVRIPRTGTYDLVIDGDDDEIFSYAVTVRRVTRTVVNTTLGRQVSNAIKVPGEVDIVAFPGRAGQNLNLNFSIEDGVSIWDGSWSIVRVGGLGEVIDSGSNLDDADDIELPANGRYHLIVDGDEDETFTWSVTIN